MSTYAYIQNGFIVEFKNIDDTLYQSWVSANNPKKDVYRIVNYQSEPSVQANEIAEYSFQINENSVDQVWTVRPKTIDELRKVWTAYEFLNRFTYLERAAYRQLAKTDDIVADFMSLAQAAQEIISDDPTTIAGMNYLVSVGIISESRKNEILDNAN